jgi:hypothetical protein
MANISAIKKVFHTVTQAEIDAFIGFETVLWDSPFYDTNYTVSCLMELPDASVGFAILGISLLTPQGFTVKFSVNGSVGDVITIHAMASHK